MQARSAWLWYDAPRDDESGEAAAWKAAREQWFGGRAAAGAKVNQAAAQLALRGRDPFLDELDGARFRGCRRACSTPWFTDARATRTQGRSHERHLAQTPFLTCRWTACA